MTAAVDRDRDGRQAGLHTTNVLAAAERSHWRLAGAGFGMHRVEQCRILGPTPGAVRLGSRAVASGEGGHVTGKDDNPPAGACSDSPSRQTISLPPPIANRAALNAKVAGENMRVRMRFKEE